MRKLAFLILSLFLCYPDASGQNKSQSKLIGKIESNLSDYRFFSSFSNLGDFTVDSIRVDTEEKSIDLFFNEQVSYIPVRESIIAAEQLKIKEILGKKFRKYSLQLFVGKKYLSDYVPNYFRVDLPVDSLKFMPKSAQKVLYKRLFDEPFPNGLTGKHIALWHSHGKYYESKLDRWEWQRARIHTTVEDLLPMAFVVPYLDKMLENAGAITLIPRERDIQINEVIVDDDYNSGRSHILYNHEMFSFERVDSQGFKWKDEYIEHENPFKMGNHMIAKASSFFSQDKNPVEIARYIPDIPESGEYAVYISYGTNRFSLSPAQYDVVSQEGTHSFHVDQSIGAGTWIYLGKFSFRKGLNPENASVILYSLDPASLITLDAIRLGGGTGNIARKPAAGLLAENKQSLKSNTPDLKKNKLEFNPESFEWKTSGCPRYMEASRYFLQYAGMPDSSVYSPTAGLNDYNDDYQSRGEWVNYLMGKPNGPTNYRNIEGLGIPIDLCMAFHTDAGVTPNDSIIGTLGIYSMDMNDGKFPNGRSKEISRELTDIIQTQIVSDIQLSMNPSWTRRGIWNKPYSEAYRANVPTMLLELLSHQNLADMKYGLDPRFRFLVSRSIYKGILKFLSYQSARNYTVQPVPVDHFSISRLKGKQIRLNWQPAEDLLEPSATPDHYQVFMRENDGGFIALKDVCTSNSFEMELPEYDKIYSFRILAVNNGGKSFPSETLSVGIPSKSTQTALIVNAFDRICGPAIIDKGDFAGITRWEDQGVPDQLDVSFVGAPYDFDRNSKWLDDDSPGWGASDSDWEGRRIPGNTFDFPFIHGQAILAQGMAFISTSDEAFEKNDFAMGDFDLIDFIFGEEKTTPVFDSGKTEFSLFTNDMMRKITGCVNKGIPLFFSGAYVASDFKETGDTLAEEFARTTLHYTWRTNHADRRGIVYGTDSADDYWKGEWTYNSGYHPAHYTVESPDAIESWGKNTTTIMRYKSSGASAGIAHNGTGSKLVVLGFPFEGVLSEKGRFHLMEKVIGFLIERP